MTQSLQTEILGAVEGPVDEAVLRRLIKYAGASLGAVHVKNGKSNLLRSIGGYNHAAVHAPWVVLIDLDHDASCPALALSEWLPMPTGLMCFRIAVRAVESWILADRERIATFLGVSLSRIPRDPDAEHNPKHSLVSIARHSRYRRISEGVVARPGSGRMVGPLYVSLMIEFIHSYWSPEDAANNSDSLRRSCTRIIALATP